MANYSALHYSEKARKYAEEAQRIRETLSGIYTFKGSVDTFKDLPSNAEVGDVYDVREDNANYAWTGDQWDSLGSVLDLSGYATKSEIPTTANQVGALPNTTKYGFGLSYTDNTLKLLDQYGNALGSSVEIKAGGSGRNVGDIFYTTRTDTELNGAVECNGGTYNTNDFTGEQAIGNLLGLGKVPYVSLSQYASLVSTNGSCRAFGWDGGDSFRVPTLKDVYIEAGTATSAGEFISESLPNIKGEFATHQSDGILKPTNICKGAFYQGSQRGNTYAGQGSTGYDLGFDASRSSSTYQDGAKVKPDSVRYRAMVQLANEATDEALIAATSVVQDMANLKDASNFTAEGKQNIVGWGMPDFSRIVSKGYGSENAPNIADTDALIIYCGSATSNNGAGPRLLVYINDTIKWLQVSGGGGSGLNTYLGAQNIIIPKGTKYYGTSASSSYMYEIPLKGV